MSDMKRIFTEGLYFSEHSMIMANDKPWEGKDLFCKKLRIIERIMRKNGDDTYTKRAGYQYCDICPMEDEVGVNTSTYHVIRDGITYVWQEDYRRHYIEKHNIEPTRIFKHLVDRIISELKAQNIEEEKIEMVDNPVRSGEKIVPPVIKEDREKKNTTQSIYGGMNEDIDEALEEL